MPGRKPRPPIQRILERIVIDENECWRWPGGKCWQGYGLIGIGRTSRTVHRVVYEALVGPVPEGLHLDHLCRVRDCSNPDHLEPVTPIENVRRGKHGVLKTHCVHGHLYDESNTYRWQGKEFCKACHSRRSAAYRAKHKAAS